MKHNQQRARSGKKSRGSISLLERIQPDAAGIDCGQNSISWRSRPIGLRVVTTMLRKYGVKKTCNSD
jgi:hypothetical protein